MRFPRLFEGRREPDPLAGLNPTFRLKRGPWYFNREKDFITDRGLSIKIRFAFDAPDELAETDFLAKIGVNLDESIPHKFIGFAYANPQERSRLEEYAHSYPYAELITDLDREGEISEHSQRVPLKG